MPDESAVPSLDTTSPGSVFISYSRDDLARVDPIVQLLSEAGLYVWWDREIAVGTPFRSAIQTILDEAACVVVFWSLTSVASQFVHSEASLGQEKGILVPILLDAAARIPVGFTELQFLDLTQWDGTANQLSRLIHPIRRLVARGPAKNSYVSTLFKNDWGVGNSQRVVSELAGLTAQIRSLADILIVDSPAARDLRAVLHEVDKTYRVVSSAVLQFVTPALSAGPLDARPYLELERGGLRTRIENGRGHCGLILTYYGRYGGVRDSLVTKLDPTMLDQVDAAFSGWAPPMATFSSPSSTSAKSSPMNPGSSAA